MTREQQLEAIRGKVIAVVPEIMELEFGCRVLHRFQREKGLGHEGIFVAISRGKNWEVWFNNFPEEVMISCQPYTSTLRPQEMEIIGRPIRLADILLAIDFERGMPTPTYNERVIAICRQWNKHADDITSQDDSTIQFIFDLLR